MTGHGQVMVYALGVEHAILNEAGVSQSLDQATSKAI